MLVACDGAHQHERRWRQRPRLQWRSAPRQRSVAFSFSWRSARSIRSVHLSWFCWKLPSGSRGCANEAPEGMSCVVSGYGRAPVSCPLVGPSAVFPRCRQHFDQEVPICVICSFFAASRPLVRLSSSYSRPRDGAIGALIPHARVSGLLPARLRAGARLARLAYVGSQHVMGELEAVAPAYHQTQRAVAFGARGRGRP